jgi:hypothetical protein
MKSIHLVKFGAILLAILGATLAANVPAAEPAGEDAAAKVYMVVYGLTDLPVYRLHAGASEFDPSLLISLIEKSVAPESWNAGGGSIAAYPKNMSIVVAQTQANHDRVASLLNSLRKRAADWTIGTRGAQRVGGFPRAGRCGRMGRPSFTLGLTNHRVREH